MSYLAETSNMTTRPRTAITVTALAAAGQAALQAATRMDTNKNGTGFCCNTAVSAVRVASEF